MGERLITNGRVWDAGPVVATEVLLAGGRIREVGTGLSHSHPGVIDAGGDWLLPGFIDLHTHGGGGVDINHADVAALGTLGRFFATQGVTGYLPTIVTDTLEQTLDCLAVLAAAQSQPVPGPRILGAHLEGPYLAPEYAGAAPRDLLRPPAIADLALYHDAFRGGRLHLTVAAELPGMPDFIAAARTLGMSVALGHTGATYETTRACIAAGATIATHTFNGMKLPHQHAPAATGAILESDLYCEAICDGRHLHPGMVRLLLKCQGPDRVIAVTDSIAAAGLPDGEYFLGVNTIQVKDGDAWLKDGTSRAGSTLTMAAALRNLAAWTNRPFPEVAPLLTRNPAAALGLGDRKGRLAVGFDADLVQLDLTGAVRRTIVGGDQIWERP